MHVEKRTNCANYLNDSTLENEQKKLASTLRKSERLFNENELDKAKVDNRETWKVLNNIIGKG